MTDKHLVLIGLMGAGKTTVGRRCASRLGREFVDTDELVATHAGAPISEIFADAGEAHFRELERAVVADVCASPVPLVVACGGGTVVDAENRRRLRACGYVVWLQAPVDVLAARVGTGKTRPLLAGDARGTLSRLEAAREVAYDSAADARVDTADRDADAVADDVLACFSTVAS